jgi:hypothetical protein
MALAEVVVAAADEMEVHLDNPPHHPADKVVRHPLVMIPLGIILQRANHLGKTQDDQETVEVQLRIPDARLLQVKTEA